MWCECSRSWDLGYHSSIPSLMLLVSAMSVETVDSHYLEDVVSNIRTSRYRFMGRKYNQRCSEMSRDMLILNWIWRYYGLPKCDVYEKEMPCPVQSSISYIIFGIHSMACKKSLFWSLVSFLSECVQLGLLFILQLTHIGNSVPQTVMFDEKVMLGKWNWTCMIEPCTLNIVM